ncbi:hypothetical protein QUF63_09585 [Anaerolineales bacterium HSG25]|nr:hypothetical protein [Anaerolineales bacterium HSG25]
MSMSQDFIINALPWHDAEVHNFNISWPDDGAAQALLRLEINPEESLKPLVEIGINSTVVDIRFEQIWRLKSDIRGDSWPKEVLLDWKVIHPSPLIDDLRQHGMAQDTRLYHQQLCFSGGSVVDVVFEKICLNEVVYEFLD